MAEETREVARGITMRCAHDPENYDHMACETCIAAALARESAAAALAEAAKHADCCVDREEIARLRAQVAELREALERLIRHHNTEDCAGNKSLDSPDSWYGTMKPRQRGEVSSTSEKPSVEELNRHVEAVEHTPQCRHDEPVQSEQFPIEGDGKRHRLRAHYHFRARRDHAHLREYCAILESIDVREIGDAHLVDALVSRRWITRGTEQEMVLCRPSEGDGEEFVLIRGVEGFDGPQGAFPRTSRCRIRLNVSNECPDIFRQPFHAFFAVLGELLGVREEREQRPAIYELGAGKLPCDVIERAAHIVDTVADDERPRFIWDATSMTEAERIVAAFRLRLDGERWRLLLEEGSDQIIERIEVFLGPTPLGPASLNLRLTRHEGDGL